MDKRGINKLVFGSLFLIIIVTGMYFVAGTIVSNSNLNDNKIWVNTTANVIVNGHDRWIDYNTTEIINFTINLNRTTGITSNITQVNISVMNLSGSYLNFSDVGLRVGFTGNDNANASRNGSRVYDFYGGSEIANFSLINDDLRTGQQVAAVGWNSSSTSGANGIWNDSVANFWFNVTANVTTKAINITRNFTWVVNLYNATGVKGGAGHTQYNVSYTGTDDIGPSFSELNVTGGDANTGFRTITQANLNLSPSSQGINVVTNDSDLNISVIITDYTLNLSNVTLVWNRSGGSYRGDYLNKSDNMTLIMNTSGTNSPYKFTGNLSKGNFSGGNFTTIIFNIVANDVFLHNGSTNSTNSGIYGTNIFGFNITVDPTAPTVTLTAPSDTSIGVQESIKYICSASDDIGGIDTGTYKIQITKPDSAIVEKTGSSATFSGIDTGQAGTYQVKCLVKNYAGLEGTASKSFTTSESSSNAGGSGSSGGGTTRAGASSPTVTSIQDSDLTVDTLSTISNVAEQAVNDITKVAVVTVSSTQTIGESSGVAIAFQSLQGLNKATISQAVHTLFVEKVTANSAVIIIKSEPLKTTLNVGQTKEFDINRDEIADIKVTLNSVKGTDADFTITRLAGADALAVTEGGVVTPPVTAPKTQPTGGSSVIIWIVIIVIILLIIWAVVAKKKKRR